MKTIMISVKPKYAELEMNGKKTIEVRKNYIEPPFKVVNYVTKGEKLYLDYECLPSWNGGYHFNENNSADNYNDQLLNGAVAYEYVVNKVDTIINNYSNFYVKGEDVAYTNRTANQSCLQFPDLRDYLKSKNGYAWHISDLKIYDKPKELEEFNGYCKKKQECYLDIVRHCNELHFDWKCNPVKRAPRNYIYVEDLSEAQNETT